MFRGARLVAIALAIAAPAAAGTPAVPQAASPTSIAVSGDLDADRAGPAISRYIFSQFAEHIGSGIYGGLWVGPKSPIPNTRGMRNDVLAALRALKVPLVRWPGGCFADFYHWRDGIGPQRDRPARVNTHWGGIIEPNSFGTHEFMDFVEAIGSEAYVNGNVGTSTPAETMAWLEYMTATGGTLAEERARNGRKAPWKVAFWGIGNELWGCGGQMRADYAADLTRQYSQFIKVPIGTRPLLVASGPDAADYNWTDVMMRETGTRIDELALHYYTIPDRKGAFGSGTDFDEASYARTLSKTLLMEELVSRHSAIMDKYDPEKRVGLAVDEWGVLTDIVPGHGPRSLFMQNSLRDALLASLNFDIFIRHADRVRMTAIAQMINVAQSMILTDGAKMFVTPTYYAFQMYVPFQDAISLPLDLQSPAYSKGEWTMPAVSGVAARGKDGKIHLALTNVDANRSAALSVRVNGVRSGTVTGRILTASGVTAHNDFGTPDTVKPAAFSGASLDGDRLAVTLPAHSLVVLDLGQ
nr:alpha-N-arabinofuranosidase [Sphingomonas sp.]